MTETTEKKRGERTERWQIIPPTMRG